MRSLIVLTTLLLGVGPAWAAEPSNSGSPKPAPVIVETVPAQLAKAPPPVMPPSFQFEFGKSTHPDDRMNPFDPADQQRNQSHGLTVGPGDDIPRRPLFGRF